MTKQELIKSLDLKPHIEGGYFRRTYTSDLTISSNQKNQPILSSIYYLLTDDRPIGYLHRNKSDIMHYYHGGSPICYTLLSPQGDLQQLTLGQNLKNNQQLQLLVPGGYWKASQLLEGEYGLISEAVAPAFEYEDMQIADKPTIQADFPDLFKKIKHLIMNS